MWRSATVAALLLLAVIGACTKRGRWYGAQSGGTHDDRDFARVDDADLHQLDVVFNAAYGTVAVIDMPQERASGARWTTTAHGWAAMVAHAQGREPYLGVGEEGRAGGGGWWVGWVC